LKKSWNEVKVSKFSYNKGFLMNKEIREIIRDIKEFYPDASEEEIKKAIIDYVESHLLEILAKIDLPSPKKQGFSRKGGYRQARSQFKLEQLQEDRSKTALVNTLTKIREEFLESGMKEDADRFTKHITEIESASTTKKSALMRVDSVLSERIKREETVKEDRSRTIRKLEDLGGYDNE
jgi:hypothetical protein